ncbi:hypothetical protein FJZ36_07315 [Candidatus Poribacteria bacterium]|nr:hypothetical protein [Candidatus Poribacteria bacterium]
MRRWAAIASLAVVLAYSTQALRAQSAYGPGGLFMIPSAYTLGEGKVALGMMGGKEGMWAPHGEHDHLWLATAVGLGASPRLDVGFGQIALQDVNTSPTWGAFGKYLLAEERGIAPAMALSGVYMPVWHWKTQMLALSASKTIRFSDSMVAHVHAGAMRAWLFNGLSTSAHPYRPDGWKPGDPIPADHAAFDPKRSVVRQVPFAGADIALGSYVKLTLEGRPRLIVDHPDAIPAKAGIIFALPKGGRLGFAWGSDGLDSEQSLTIGVGYNISAVD